MRCFDRGSFIVHINSEAAAIFESQLIMFVHTNNEFI
jgi:hypothetical protein